MLRKKLKISTLKSIVIITHFFTTGPASELKEYVVPITENVIYIRHPFSFTPGENRSSCEYYKNGKLISRSYFSGILKNNLLLYIKDFIATIYFLIKHSIHHAGVVRKRLTRNL